MVSAIENLAYISANKHTDSIVACESMDRISANENTTNEHTSNISAASNEMAN